LIFNGFNQVDRGTGLFQELFLSVTNKMSIPNESNGKYENDGTMFHNRVHYFT